MKNPFAPICPRARAAVSGNEGKYRARTTLHDPCFSSAAFFFFLIVLALFAPLPATASDPFAGKITSIDSGEAPQVLNIVRPGKTGLAKAKPGDAIFVGDTVKTGPDVKAQIQLSDRSLINVGPNSTFRVKGYALSPSEAKRTYVLKALKGTIRFIISKVFKNNSSGAELPWKDTNITVETATTVAGVHGTDFVVVVDTANPAPSVDIAVLDGLVTVRNISLSVQEVIHLSAKEVTTVKRGLKPAKPEALSQERRNELTRITTPNASALHTASKDKRAEKYTCTDMERDISAGEPLPQVLDQAAAAGMTVSQMVACAIDAGVEPNVVVYAAITEGYPARDVVATTVNDGAPLYDVVAAAVAAGAEKKVVIEGATDAGAPASSVASAVALASTSSAPVYGYTSPIGTTVETIIPSDPILIGGGGGVTPSTLPASPYKP